MPTHVYRSETCLYVHTVVSNHCAFVLQEVENAYHSSALLIQMQLIQAQTAGTSISVDTTQLENEAHLQRIKACEQAAMTRPAADFAMKRAGMHASLQVSTLQVVAS